MQATSKIVGKLRNARFQPPQGGPREKLAWINDGEADLLRSIGGSGKRRKFGLPSFAPNQSSNTSNGNSRSMGPGNGGSSISRGGDSGSRAGVRSGTVTGAVIRSQLAAPIVTPRPKPRVAAPLPPPVMLAPIAPVVPRPKPMVAAPAPTIQPQNFGFVSPTVAPAVPKAAPKIAPQNFGFVAPRATAPMTPRAAPTIRAQNFGFSAPSAPTIRAQQLGFRAPSAPAVRDDRMPSGSFTPSSFHAPRVRDDRMPAAPGAGVKSVPEGPRTDRMPSGSFTPTSVREPVVRTDRMSRTPESITSMAAEAAARAAANRSRVPEGGIPIPRQNPLSDTSKFQYDKGRPRDYVFNGAGQAEISRLVSMQQGFGKPFRITSGFRDPALNAKVGGAKKSQHMQGKAFDVHIASADRAEYERLAREAALAGFTGLGAYRPGSLHVDTGPTRTWGGSKKTVNAARARALKDRSITAYAGLDDN